MGKTKGIPYNEIIEAYRKTPSVNQVVEATGICKCTVQKVLITEGLWESKRSREAIRLKEQGLSTEEIADVLHITVKGVQAYLPYSRKPYGNSETSDSLKSRKKREKMQIAAQRQVSAPAPKSIRLYEPKGESLSMIEKMDRTPKAYRLHLELVQDEDGTAIRFSSEEEEILRKYARYRTGFSRDIIVPSDMTLHALHYSIQRLFGWGNSHLREFSLMPDDFAAVTNGLTSVWENLCGVLFRFPEEDNQELFWDDDYNGRQSFKTWLKQKYTGPYSTYCTCDTYSGNQRLVTQFNREFPQYAKTEPAEKLNDFQGQVWLGGNLNCLMERIRLSELFVPENVDLPCRDEWKTFIRSSIQQAKNSEPELLPFVHAIMYQYDFGDGWCVKISCEEGYCSKAGLDSEDAADIATGISGSSAFFRIGDGCRINNGFNEILSYVAFKKNPICVSADGMNLVDDVGGVFGFVDFIETLHGDDAEEAQEMKNWAESLGWSLRMNKPEKML